jgi:short chain dehydrogenase
MRRQRSGHLFTIASMGGYLGGSRGTAYAASKFAVAGFTESLAFELEEFGITATIVGPGYFRTDFLDKSSAILEPATLIEDYRASNAAFRDVYGVTSTRTSMFGRREDARPRAKLRPRKPELRHEDHLCCGLDFDGEHGPRHAGSSNQNVLPAGTPGSTPMVPPWASIASLQKARPNPNDL